jgi:hypothetical protein
LAGKKKIAERQDFFNVPMSKEQRRLFRLALRLPLRLNFGG